jgi:GNAT superfamily N-acetyltransferase
MLAPMGGAALVAFDDSHLEGAVALLRRRHEAHRAVQPLLAAAPDYAAILAAERTDATGAAAVKGGEVVGFLLGRHADGPFGPHVWSTGAGQATDDPWLVADLYGIAAQAWVDAGLKSHYLYVPATRSLIEPWFRIGFGASAVQAARSIGTGDADVAPASWVRRSVPEDLTAIAALARELPLHLVTSPSFSTVPVESLAELEAEWSDTWDRDDFVHFVAERDGRLVGQLLLFRRPATDLRVPVGSIDLASATTWPEVRGQGVARALFAAALRFAAEDGVQVMTTDWRAGNLLAARVWPTMGFKPTYLRLERTIG